MIVTSLNKIANLNMILSYSDAVMAGSNATSVLNETSFTKEELIKIKDFVHSKNKLFFLKVNGLLHENQIEDYKEFITAFLDADGFYASDLGVVLILNELGLKDRIIFDPQTLICNSLDAKIYLEESPYGIGLSQEIPLCDIEKISNCVEHKIFYKIFGYHPMCFSKRKLISLYLEENRLTKKTGIYYLKEEKREDFYPIIENEYGTIILRSHVVNLLRHLKTLKVAFLFVETFLIAEDKILEVLKLINKVMNNQMTADAACDAYDKLGIPTSEGFTYHDSVYLKEEMKNV